MFCITVNYMLEISHFCFVLLLIFKGGKRNTFSLRRDFTVLHNIETNKHYGKF